MSDPLSAIKAAASAVASEQGGTGEDYKCGGVQDDSGWDSKSE